MFLLGQDAISGKEGTAFANINGQIKEMFYLKKLKATADKKKAEMKVVGTRVVQHKAKELVYTGNMTIYDVSPDYIDMISQYEKTGVDTYFTIQIVNDDPTSTVGVKRTVLYNCNVDKLPIAQLDADADFLEQEVDFTFTSFEPLDEQVAPAVLGGN
ncbi:MAG: phage tail tube protein [Negativicutes bacterium]|nr:phage tail tube protein [Negativicutes bacterium]